jgi:hypothetical protein
MQSHDNRRTGVPPVPWAPEHGRDVRATRCIGVWCALVLLGSVCRAQAVHPERDWLIDPSGYRATATQADGQITLQNGLVRRVIELAPNAATVAFDDLINRDALVRSVRPEARVELDGTHYDVGGLLGQKVHNYLDPAWLKDLTADPAAFHCTGATFGKTAERFPWKPRPEWMPKPLPWPPPGAAVTLSFAGPAAVANVIVDVHYEIYDGLPLISKWITVHNGTDRPVRLNTFASEVLAAVEGESSVDAEPAWQLPALRVETDYAFGGMSPAARNVAVHWEPDPLYATQVNYERQTPCLLECRPPIGPDQIIPPGGTFTSFRAFELALDSTDRERRGLAVRRMYRTIAPWVTENPILMHVRGSDPAAVRLAVDQCADVGFEMVIMTFGSGFNFESRSPAYQQQIKVLADYARTKGIALGGYSLLSSRSAADKADNVQGVTARFGVAPCLASQWGADYLAQLRSFIQTAGLGVLENDGSYPGDLCAATTHPFHRGLADSQWAQWTAITGLYQWCRANGVYLNVPDWYFLNGSSKTGMGYRETNWSLPREYQEIIERQNVFDGTWDKTPSMGWMFVPLTQYHGGGAAATIEPLKDHLPHYEHRLANLFGTGVQACYRGPRLFDAPETEAMVKRMVGFYKLHRAILDSDIIHLRRADGRDLDYVLHVNPQLPERGLLMVYNPTPAEVTREIDVPLYYTGLTGDARISDRDGEAKPVTLDRDYTVRVPVTVPANGYTWFVIRRSAG